MTQRPAPLSLKAARKSGARAQVGALCYRFVNDRLQILLITSRTTQRWIVPKGWPIDGCTAEESASQEAYEEAGVIGKTRGPYLGLFSYEKDREDAQPLPCVVMLFPLKVKALERDYPESAERQRKWFSQKKAAQHVTEPELARLIKQFDPRQLRK